jgi:pimeloyl-ACP methyl ester carboxylesterase
LTQKGIAQRSGQKLYFDHRDLDYYFAWITGRAIYEGSDPDECFAAASRIVDGDVASWEREWVALAERVVDEAQAALSRGDAESARKAYLRACTYYRAPMFVMSPKAPAFREYWRQMHGCFRRAVPLFDRPVEVVEVPFQGKRLAGYFWKVDGSGRRRPTLIVFGGIETFGEDCYFLIGPSGAARGYNVLAVDLPGQGVNPDQGLYFGARMEVPLKAVVDYALARPEVDAGRLVVHGISWGGHIVFKGAAHDPRIRAMIANPAMPDVFRAALGQQRGHRGDPVSRVVFDQIVWRMGLRISLNPGDLWKRVVKAYEYFRYGKVDLRQVRCPVLCLAGEGEAKITLDIARECAQRLPHPQSRTVIFTKEEGGEAHCQVNNLALPNRVMFDWLEEVLPAGEPR